MLVVRDNGLGIEKKTMTRIFDPFFTTKEQGKGTGLGLSTVYGIVKQSGGHITVYSERGNGSSFHVYLPRTAETGAIPVPEKQEAINLRGHETILLVEDELLVRELTQTVLEEKGCSILTAEDFSEAQAACKKHQGPIHLLLTDMVLPGGTGRKLSEQIQEMRPETKVLFMSGYTSDSVLSHGVLDSGVHFLQKPFIPSQLAKKVRDILDFKD